MKVLPEQVSVNKTSRNARLSILVGAAISVLAFWLIARSVSLSEVGAALSASHLGWVALAFGTQLLAMLALVRRWQILLRPYPTHFLKLAQIYFITHLLNTLLPVKLGIVARVALPVELEGLNTGFVIGSIAIEKVVDTLFMLALLLVLAPFIPLPLWLRESLVASVLLALIGLLALASVRRIRAPLLSALTRAESRFLGAQSNRFVTLVSGMLESIAQLTQRREAISVFVWTVLMWFAGILVNQMLLMALGIPVDWSAAWFLLVVLQLGTRVPALPANLGVFHYLVILALGMYGVAASPALAYALLLHLIVFILPAVIGAACALPVSAELVRLLSDGRGRAAKGEHAAP